jgi:hypothetical protein
LLDDIAQTPSPVVNIQYRPSTFADHARRVVTRRDLRVRQLAEQQ